MSATSYGKITAGFLLFLGSAQFITILMAAGAIAPGYSLHENAISDLGVIPATQILFNSSLFAIGLLIAAGGYLFHGAHRKAWITALFLLGGIGAMGAGIFNLSFGIHGIFAFMAFLFINLLTIACERFVKGPLRVVSPILGAIGLFFLALMLAGDMGILAFGAIGHGGTERMIAYPGLLWLLVFGGYLMAAKG